MEQIGNLIMHGSLLHEILISIHHFSNHFDDDVHPPFILGQQGEEKLKGIFAGE